MSVRIVSNVFRYSESEGAERCVLLALADGARDDGISWDDQPTIAAKAKVAERSLRTYLKRLEGRGDLQVERFRRGRANRNAYRVLVGDVDDPIADRLPPDIAALFVRQDRPHEKPVVRQAGAPSSGKQRERAREDDPSSTRKTAARPRPRDPIWDTLASLYGDPAPHERAHRGKRVREIRDALHAMTGPACYTGDDYADEIRRRHAALVKAWGADKVTLDALVKHWTFAGQLASRGAPGPRPTPLEGSGEVF